MRIRNLGSVTSNTGNNVNPDPLSVIVMLVIIPPAITAVPKAPVPVVSPTALEIRTLTKLYPVPPEVIDTEATLYVRLKVAPTPIGPIAPGPEVLIVVPTLLEPGNVVYIPADNILYVRMAPGVLCVLNISMVVTPVPTPPEMDRISPG